MTTNTRFISALIEMNSIMRQDNKNGHQWRYCNIYKKKERSFGDARSKGKYLTNCCDGVHWGCQIAGIPVSALLWYGSKGGNITWCSSNAEKNCRKFFDLIKVGNKTVSQLVKDGTLCEGDILTYVSMSHTNAYLGDIGNKRNRSFDSGHAYCSGSGEGAKFRKWIGALSCRNYKVGYIIRIKDRDYYKVFAGTFDKREDANTQVKRLKSLGFNPSVKEADGAYKVQLGCFPGKKSADKLVKRLSNKGISAFIKTC